MKYTLKYEKVTKKNIKQAIKIQNRLFPLEDGIDDLNEAINNSEKYFEVLEYYLVHDGEYYVGITGIYSHKEYPEDAWVGWFGILPAFRKCGYGKEVMLYTKEKAKKKGFKHLRLYTDDQINHISVKLFEKLGMEKEEYTRENGKYYQVGKMLIFSWSLTDEKVKPWNNKLLFLEEHEMKNNKLELKYVEINKNNIKQAANLQYNMFYSCNNVGYLDYLKEIETKDRFKKRLLPIDFLVYHGDTPVGIIGLYEKPEYPEDIWITWFGVAAKYRNHGIGSQMLLKIIEIAKFYNKKNLRLNTYETWNYKALGIYNRTMQRGEPYEHPKEDRFLIRYGKPKIYSISLVDKEVTPWNNKYLNLTEELDLNEQSIEKLKKDNILELFTESTFMENLKVSKE